jgi:citrate lyase subunit beta/citryl-CoA lyase
MVAEALRDHPAWVRINGSRNSVAAADLGAVSEPAYGMRIPKVETVADVRWVAERAPGKPLLCAIESARGVVNALAIAAEPRVAHLALGGIDLQTDLRVASGHAPLDYVRSHLVLACRAADIDPPIDSVYPHLADDDGLHTQAAASRALGLFGKSAIHAVFGTDADETSWARQVVEAFEASNGGAVRLPSGEFVDLPVAQRVHDILQPNTPATAAPGR